MRYLRFDRPDPGYAVAVSTAPDIRKTASAKAELLRARAARYRALAATIYNQNLVSEVEALAHELDDEAATLEVATSPILPRARH